MTAFHLYAFIPFGVLLGTAFLAAFICMFINVAQGPAGRHPAPMRSAEILYFPAQKPRRQEANALARQPAPRGAYARTPLAG